MNLDIAQLILTTGAAGVALWVLKAFIDGKVHSDSEVDLHEIRAAEHLKNIERLSTALEASNNQAAAIISLWKALQSRDMQE